MTANLSIIGLARKGGMIAMGEEPCGNACRMYKAAAVFTASDAADNSIRRAAGFAELGGVPHIKLDATKEQLGASCGRSSLAMFAITDAGFALTVAKRLANCDAEILEILQSASARTAKLKKECKKK